jgi:Cu/Ag efflux protein CusF
MRYILTALLCVGVLAVSAQAMEQSSKPAAKTSTAATHSVQGVVKSVDASSLVITRSGKKGGDMSFTLEPTTHQEGSIGTGSTVSIRYRMEGSSMVATAVNAETPKPAQAAKH